jgi:aryl-alcohol dehydrogenase-like predicted oxidoreductase
MRITGPGIGVSNFSEDQLREAERVVPVVWVQNRLSTTDRTSETTVELCEQEMLVFLYSCRGRRSSRPTSATPSSTLPGATG